MRQFGVAVTLVGRSFLNLGLLTGCLIDVCYGFPLPVHVNFWLLH